MPSRKKVLRVSWSKRERDIVFHSPASADGYMMHVLLHHTNIVYNRTFREELEARGYDITTLKFIIERKSDA